MSISKPGDPVVQYINMYVRTRRNKRQNKPDSISVQVVQKSYGSLKIIKHVGTSDNPDEIEYLRGVAQEYINTLTRQEQPTLFGTKGFTTVLQRLTNIRIHKHAFHDIFGPVFDELQLPHIHNKELLRDVVIARIAFPRSKRKIAWWLNTYCGKQYSEDQIYLLMDRLDHLKRIQISNAVYNYVSKVYDSQIRIIFFDATTLHFESFSDDSLRKCGYSKVGKHNQPQIVVGLMVTAEGLPLGYDVYPGNKFDGHTIRSALHKVAARYKAEDVVFVADAAMMSKANLSMLERQGFGYIIAAKIRNMSNDIKRTILDRSKYENGILDLNYAEGRLIVTYSESRARKDRRLREDHLQRTKKALLSSSTVSKSKLGRFGKTKFLRIKGKSRVELDYDKISEDSLWDGLKGYFTNLTEKQASPELIVQQYTQLWQVEKAFRLSKQDLKIRPVFHWKPQRVRGHILITFLSLFLSRYVEYRLARLGYSISWIVDNLDTVFATQLEDKETGAILEIHSDVSETVQNIYRELGLEPPPAGVTTKIIYPNLRRP